jgi:hypothetical protein
MTVAAASCARGWPFTGCSALQRLGDCAAGCGTAAVDDVLRAATGRRGVSGGLTVIAAALAFAGGEVQRPLSPRA